MNLINNIIENNPFICFLNMQNKAPFQYDTIKKDVPWHNATERLCSTLVVYHGVLSLSTPILYYFSAAKAVCAIHCEPSSEIIH